MDCDPVQPKRLRISIEMETQQPTDQKSNCPVPVLQTRSHQLCNELVFEVCRDIPLEKTSDSHLLIASNIYTYLVGRYRKKILQIELFYRDAIAFIRRRLNESRADGVSIRIDLLAGSNESEYLVIHQQQCDADYFQFMTNQLLIQMEPGEYMTEECLFKSKQFDNGHVQFFIRLIASLLPRPNVLFLKRLGANDPAIAAAVHCLNSLRHCIDWIKLSRNQFIATPIYAALFVRDKLEIDFRYPYLGDDQEQQFRRMFIQWLNSGNSGQPKICSINHYVRYQGLVLLLDEIKEDFCLATSKCSFALVICFPTQITNNQDTNIGNYVLHNDVVGEQLELGSTAEDAWWTNYTLIRCPIEGLERNKFMATFSKHSGGTKHLFPLRIST